LASPLDFRLLGPLEVRDGDRPLPPGGRKQRTLLALLLLHANEVVSSDTFIDGLWERASKIEGRRSRCTSPPAKLLRRAIGDAQAGLSSRPRAQRPCEPRHALARGEPAGA
jgi:hypothetical protein